MQNKHTDLTDPRDVSGYWINRTDTYPVEAGYKDHDTSKEAALKICSKQLDAEILFHIKKYCFGAAPENIVQDFGYDLLSVRPAFARLKARGLIEDTGRRGKTERGNNCRIMVAV